MHMTAETNSTPLALIIEDDDKLSIIFTEALRQAGFDTRIICDGAEALAKIQTCQPAVVMLDLHLPHVAGDKILEAIHHAEHLAQTRVIITTADATLAATLRPHCDLVLIKPISFLQLRDLARQMHTAITATADQATRPGNS
jgi:DNA-binding response OmpR family regulator